MEIWKEFRFEAAHRLPMVPLGHKCARLHGHSYRCRIHVCGDLDQMGWVIDFAVIEQAFAPIRALVDHALLNDVEGLTNPTSEVLATWIWRRIVHELPGLSQVVVMETSASGCIYRGDQERPTNT